MLLLIMNVFIIILYYLNLDVLLLSSPAKTFEHHTLRLVPEDSKYLKEEE